MNIILMMVNITKLIISEKRKFDKYCKKHIGLLPEKKYQLIETAKTQTGKVAMF